MSIRTPDTRHVSVADIYRRCLAALVFLAFCVTSTAQTCALPGWDGPATASGVINAYHGGSGSPLAGATSITVASATGLRTNTRALRAGDLILIMQMQDSTTGANAGQYEYAQITAISGTTVSLNRPLTNAYNQAMSTSSVRNWQVVWVPQYSAVTVSGTVSADRWTINPATGVGSGGIVAMDVAGSLALNGTVTVAGAGFRGAVGLNGTANVAGGTATTANVAFDPTSAATINGGQKGEGIQGTPPRVFDGTLTPVNYTTLLGQGYTAGAGGQATIGNAGGGANDGDPANSGNALNAGGGGGGNAGAGGQGGNSWNNGNTANPALNQGTNTNIGNIAGGKGGGLQTDSPTRLVLGGGGGGGAANNGQGDSLATWPPTSTSTVANGATGAITSSGASGGGAVLIRAGSFSATAGVIDASGYRSYNKAVPADTDSAGGGGAGGSVFITAVTAVGAGLTIKANGA